ncbi:polyphosphate kinase [Hymenobacter luteus]|uniref:Polyphosphate kinase n=2 Tax=Hymenobacter TaxID=89966 RepID=A0A7W9WB15_9BACT|nr:MULTISPECIES: polyphosphate kinase 1 [Hymenobacter]MBB4599770.1 polyphosphate kinase [Hymenobacter latericoloratus]MBB6057920.1 polyphosphate kinase [Hymenobacter luteus]
MSETTQAQPRLLNRELSWLAFNRRVLQEAQNPEVPLLERIKFLAIFSSNLDEYFKVRVATLRRLVKLKKKTRAKLGEDPVAQLRDLLREVGRQQEAFGETFRNDILPALKAQHIHLVSEHDLTAEQRAWVQTYFREQVQDLLSPLILDDNLHHLFLRDQSVYLTFLLTQPENRKKQDEERVVVMELPTKRHGSRFVELPAQGDDKYVMFLDDVIRCCAQELFPKYQKVQVHAIKLSRDAELDIQEEVSGNMLAKIKSSLQKRETGYPARLLYDPAMPQEVLRAVMQKTGIGKDELVEGSRYHNFRDFFGFPDFGLAQLQYEPMPALPHPTLPRTGKLLPAIAERDHLLHPPYQSFDYVTRLINEAGQDPQVSSISITLYRVAGKSEVAKALLKAAKNGKQVTVVVELKARFDEESNMFWAEKLQKAGANVIYGIPELKVHSKLLLITRSEEGQNRLYAYLSTGNFNEKTSEVYADHGLFTSNPDLTREVVEVFRYFHDRQDKTGHFQHLLVAPFELREKLNALIDHEIELARDGKEAYIILKLNALQDERMILKLYEASQAGVRVELLIRGISCLIPELPGQSENIRQRGMVDRFLEHARVYVFGNGGEEKVYVASADWMARNLDRRVEVAFPILQPDLRAEVRHLLDLQRQDNVKARDFHNRFIGPEDTAAARIRSQFDTYEYLKSLCKPGKKRK